MDHQQPQGRGRSLSATSAGGGHGAHGIQQPHIKYDRSPSPARFPNSNDDGSSALGIGLGLVDPSAQQFPTTQPDYTAYTTNATSFLSNQQPAPQSFPQSSLTEPSAPFDLNQGFTDQLKAEDPSFGDHSQQGYQQNNLSFGVGEADFTIFPPTPGEPQFNAPLFVTDGQPNPSMMTQANHSPTPPHLLGPEGHQPVSASHSPSFNQHQFSTAPGRHSRNVSLGPQDALLPRQIDWSQAQFQGHRRTPSEYSDVSSVAPSPNLVSTDTFENINQSHSPMQRPQDAGLYQELQGLGNFSISDHGAHSPNHPGARSPSHSPAISPRILPQQLPEVNQQGHFLSSGYGPPPNYMQHPQEAFPQLPQDPQDMQNQMMAPPSINIDFAPTAVRSGFEPQKSLDIDSLTPPERGRRIQRPRAVTDPYKSGGGLLGRPAPGSGSLSPNLSPDSRSESARSLSPLDRSGSGGVPPGRRRHSASTPSAPNNAIALRLADPEYNGPGSQGEGGAGGAKRVQKHPATFQCTLCPKRFTRAYNLRSHLRTHTDERPFVCTVCGKAFARQHDRKRHEGLHSGEKKFVCKGDLKGGGQWGCGRRFARADALGRHFRSEAGRICIKPLLDEEMLERQRVWNEQRMQQAAAQGMAMQASGMMMPPGMDPNAGGYPIDASGNYALPQALLAQYPALAQMNWSGEMGGGSGLEEDMSGRSSFDASDYDDGDDGGYVSGPGSGFGPGGMQEGFGEIGYASDYGGR